MKYLHIIEFHEHNSNRQYKHVSILAGDYNNMLSFDNDYSEMGFFQIFLEIPI